MPVPMIQNTVFVLILLVREFLSRLKHVGGAKSCVWFSGCCLAMIFIGVVVLWHFVQFKLYCLDTQSSACLFVSLHALATGHLFLWI